MPTADRQSRTQQAVGQAKALADQFAHQMSDMSPMQWRQLRRHLRDAGLLIETVRAKLAAGGADVVIRRATLDPHEFFGELEPFFEADREANLLTRILFVDVTICESVPLRYSGNATVPVESGPDRTEEHEISYGAELVGYHLIPGGRRFAEYEIEAGPVTNAR